MTDKNREIEEMANILLETSRQVSTDKSQNKSYTVFDKDTIFKYGCDRLNGATALYNAGYRKATDVAAEIFAEIENNSFSYGVNFVISKETLEELKKKYTG